MENEENKRALPHQEGGEGRTGCGGEGPRTPGWLPSPSKGCTWTTLGMGKDEGDKFVDGPHLSGVDNGEFRCWSKATLEVSSYGNSYLTQRWLRLCELITVRGMMSKGGDHTATLFPIVAAESTSVKSKYLDT